MSNLYKGIIIRLIAFAETDIAFLEINDEMRGHTVVPCHNAQTFRTLDKAFGNVVVEGHRFDNNPIAGIEIYYSTDDLEYLEAFTPVENASPEMVAECEKAQNVGTTVRGYAPKDHPIFSRGAIIAGRNISRPPKRRFHENN